MPFIDKAGQVVEPPVFRVVDPDQFHQTPDNGEAVLGLVFETHVDGRAFSAAALFRSEGFDGQLIGTGDVGLDRVAYGFRTGFDLLWVTDEEFALLGEQHLSPFPSHYQLATPQPAARKAS